MPNGGIALKLKLLTLLSKKLNKKNKPKYLIINYLREHKSTTPTFTSLKPFILF